MTKTRIPGRLGALAAALVLAGCANYAGIAPQATLRTAQDAGVPAAASTRNTPASAMRPR